MATISVSTVVTGQTITAALWNDSFATIVNDYNGNITNANVSASAGITASKIAFGGTSGQILKSDGSGGITYGGAGRAFTWGLVGTLTTGDGQGMKYIVPNAMTCVKIKAYTDSGTCNIRISKNGSSMITMTGVTTSVTSTNDTTALAENDKLTLDVTGVTNASGVWIVLECTQN